MLSDFFQLVPLSGEQMKTTYSIHLVILSYIVAMIASYVALDITSRMRDVGVSKNAGYWWLLGGSFAMGAGIWSMHFIGMLAFNMPMTMGYTPGYTGLSMLIAIIASGIAFSLLRTKTIKRPYLILGGIILGLSIASMHYVGMAAMSGVIIRYEPTLFLLSILIAIAASEVALYLALKSAKGTIKARMRLKIISAFIMGAAICGMHYTGMAAAVFEATHHLDHTVWQMDPNMLAAAIAIVTMFILIIAVTLSSFQAIFSTQSAEMARKAGMAEVASNVLHNVGNALNSVNVAASILMEHVNNLDIKNLKEVNTLLKTHQSDLGSYISKDPRGSNIPLFLSQLTDHWDKEVNDLKIEIKQLSYNIEHIKHIIAAQQKLSGISNFEELVSIEQIVEEALILVSIDFNRHNISIKREYFKKLQPVYIDKSKLTQLIINLIRNAKESLIASTNPEKEIVLRTLLNKKKFSIKVCDNGLGISLENQTKIFSHGFTTKISGHGFGLHASALAAHQMGGTLSVASNKGAGVTFTLTLPYKVKYNPKYKVSL
jgi:NO-binding membrane sensor protein with MHYT domain